MIDFSLNSQQKALLEMARDIAGIKEEKK